MTKIEQQPQSNKQEKSPLDIMLEIKETLHDPLPEPPKGATWVDKDYEEMTDEEKRESVAFTMLIIDIIADRPDKEPSSDHPRYAEYLIAKREYESWFRISPEDLHRKFTI